MKTFLALAFLWAVTLCAQPPTNQITFPSQFVVTEPGVCAEGQTIYNAVTHVSKICGLTNNWILIGGGGAAFVYTGVLSGIPATCTIGQLAFITNATAGQNQYNCTSTNVWTQNSGGGVTITSPDGSATIGGTASAPTIAANTPGFYNALYAQIAATNSYTAGMKQIFQSSLTTAGRQDVGVADPSTLVSGDQWASLAGNPRWYDGVTKWSPLATDTAITSYSKGDIFCASGSTTMAKIGVGSNTQALVADSTQTCGVKWAAPGVASAAFATLTDGATVSWTPAAVLVSNAALTFTAHSGSRTLNLSGLVSGGSYVLELTQDATGGMGLTLGTGCTWKIFGGGAGAVTLTNAANALDVLSFLYDGTRCIGSVQPNAN